MVKKRIPKSKIALETQAPPRTNSYWRKVVARPNFPKFYATGALIILLLTTVLWATLGARVQQSNADQSANVFLFKYATTFRGAIWPGAHSQLIKWPLFLLINLFGSSAKALVIFTVGLVVVTVACLVGILYKIEKRPLVFGTLCIALASVLLMIPAQPYTGGLLPVNMAMLTTRNLEYVIYIIGIVLLVRSPRIKSRQFITAIALLGLLIASDKLFLSISLGGALMALIVYALVNIWEFVSVSVTWLVGSFLAGVLATVILWLINTGGLTHITGQSGVSPYGLVQNAHSLVLAISYGILSIFTNFGANPAASTTIFRSIPHQTLLHILSASGPIYIINTCLLFFGIFLATRKVTSSLKSPKSLDQKIDTWEKTSTLLIWATLATLGVFIATNHYYAGDARYLAITTFTLFIIVASYARNRVWQSNQLVGIGVVMVVAIVLALPSVIKTYHDDKNSLAPNDARNTTVNVVLASHHASVLVGDYWRVIPAKLAAGGNLNVLPLGNCSQPKTTLISKSWEPNLNQHSFAYLLSLDGSLTDYPNCTLKQVVSAYGRPNASTLIAGTLTQPKELLLFYDHGINSSAPKTPSPPQGPATVVPITLDQLPYTSCNVPTTMNVVAHQDDDLLFMNPDLINEIKEGRCVRTIYVTAGDAGQNQFYWLGREKGSEAAYSEMLGINDIWVQRIVKLSNSEFITVANPRGNAKISLIFLHLPDGNLTGNGFRESDFESVARLEAKQIKTIRAVDGQSTYSYTELVDALTNLMLTYQPTEIHTQANLASKTYPDHSDHMAVGRLTKISYQQYEKQQFDDQVVIPIKFYVGYPIHQFPENVTGTELKEKELAFFSYAEFDGGVCHSLSTCQSNSTYSTYLQRQYQNAY